MFRSTMFATLAVCLFTSAAYAGEAERDQKNKITPEIAKTKESVSTACGCAPEFDVNWDSYPDAKQMQWIGKELSASADELSKFCKKNEDNKKVFCANVGQKLKKVTVSYGQLTDSKLAGDTVVATTNANSYRGAIDLMKEVRSW